MPLQRCSSDGEAGWRWGNSGKCYIGKDAKLKALKQGYVIEGPDKFQKVMSHLRDVLYTETELAEAIKAWKNY